MVLVPLPPSIFQMACEIFFPGKNLICQEVIKIDLKEISSIIACDLANDFHANFN